MLVEKSWRGTEMVVPIALVLGLTLLGAFTLIRPPAEPTAPSVSSLWSVVLVIQLPILLYSHWFLRQHGTGWNEGFGFRVRPKPHLWVWIVGSIVGCVLVLLGINTGIQQLLTGPGGQPHLQEGVRALESGTAAVKASVAFAAIVMAPCVEESLFRGILYQWIRDGGRPRTAGLVTSVAFGLVHGHLPSLLPLTLFGGYLCWLYERTGNLGACILTHAGFNTVFVCLTLTGVTSR